MTNRKLSKYACEIEGEYFASGAALARKCRAILDKYIYEGALPDEPLSAEDNQFFVSMVNERRPGRICPGIRMSGAFRSHRDGKPGRHLKFVYVDGSEDMIGWAKMCAGPRKTFAHVTDAMRQAVAGQSKGAFAAFFKGVEEAICPKSGKMIDSLSAVVHHDGPSFATIRDAWFADQGITHEDVELESSVVGGYLMANAEQRESWEAYHWSNAWLTVVSREWHIAHHIENPEES